jgi:hypothetical protein
VAQRPINVSSPPPESDQPKLAQVAIIAAVCFAVGALWPTLSGLRLVPAVPSSQGDDKSEAAPRAPRSPADPPSSGVPVAGLALNEASELPPAAPGEHTAAISKELIVNCHDDKDRKLSECDKPGFEQVAKDRLRALTSCEATKGTTGTLSIGFELDFTKEKITRVLKGKSTTFSDEAADALVACTKQEFMTATLRGVEHTHAKYLVFYMVELKAGSSADPAQARDQVVSATGNATIVWNSARIRSEPDDGNVVARILYGTRVVVTGRQEDWYRVKYDAKGNEGWVHKNALAL